jgi:hypothetical protein
MIYTDISQNAALVHTRESCKMFTLEAWKVFFFLLIFCYWSRDQTGHSKCCSKSTRRCCEIRLICCFYSCWAVHGSSSTPQVDIRMITLVQELLPDRLRNTALKKQPESDLTTYYHLYESFLANRGRITAIITHHW